MPPVVFVGNLTPGFNARQRITLRFFLLQAAQFETSKLCACCFYPEHPAVRHSVCRASTDRRARYIPVPFRPYVGYNCTAY